LDAQVLLIPTALIVVAYVLGSIPSGLIIARLVSGTDVRKHGSGNTGMVNVFRAAGPLAGILTFVMDGLKGFLPVFVGSQLGLPIWAVLLVAAATIMGHDWSILLRGKGGKGIATSVGVIGAISPVIALIAIVLWVGLLVTFRYASLASLLMTASFPVMLALAGYETSYVIFGVALLIVATHQHRANILRLREGSELKINFGSTRFRHSD
jgi:acyl phosphate:glycerol-3-phosphate acyltransferase